MCFKFLKRILAGGLSALSLASVPGCTSPSEPESGTVQESYLHIRPSWSPDGALIAFTVTLQASLGVYLVDSSGANMHRLVEGEGIGTTWSPDSRWVAFSRAGILYKVKVNGDSLTQLSTFYGALRPAWSRDGRRLAFVLDRLDIGGIWLYDFASDTATQLVGFGDYPSWNGLTGELVMLDVQYGAAGDQVLYRFLAIDIGTLAARTFTSFVSFSDCAFVAVSPDGGSIVYGLKPFNDLAQVWKYEAAGDRHVRLTDDGGDNPAWSPDGSRIVYTRTAKGDGGLWIMNADGSTKRRLTKP
jgi:Tol biopolymer transport system component